MLAPTVAVQAGLDAGSPLADLVLIGVGGLLIVFGMWWIYFDHDAEAMFDRAIGDDDTTARRRRLAFTLGLRPLRRVRRGGRRRRRAGGRSSTSDPTAKSEPAHRLGDVGAALGLTVPIAVFLLCMWVLHGKVRQLA